MRKTKKKAKINIIIIYIYTLKLSYESTNAKNPVGNACAYAIKAANSPKLLDQFISSRIFNVSFTISVPSNILV